MTIKTYFDDLLQCYIAYCEDYEESGIDTPKGLGETPSDAIADLIDQITVMDDIF